MTSSMKAARPGPESPRSESICSSLPPNLEHAWDMLQGSLLEVRDEVLRLRQILSLKGETRKSAAISAGGIRRRGGRH